MLFSSSVFILAFIPLTLLAYFLVPEGFVMSKNIILLAASLIFYGWGEPRYILIMLVSIILNYVLAILVEKSASSRLWLIVDIAANLALLGFFKYTDFVIETVNSLTGQGLGLLGIALPIGISFYTFQAMSYVIDVYRGQVAAQRNIIILATYITLFPQLIAGPIVRYSDVEERLKDRRSDTDHISEGIRRFIIGFGKKILIANRVAVIWTEISACENLSAGAAWLGALAFTFQIYFDFSGYSDMAIGLGKIFGFDYLENFNYPYISGSITEFWRRWHMSLSSWFKEYVYIPLGGNRKGLSRQLINIAIVWTLTGLWHGASWNFVCWGLYYGILLVIEKLGMLEVLKKHQIPGHILTFILVMIGWVIFAIDDMGRVFNYIGMMFGSCKGAGPEVFKYYLTSGFWLFVMCFIGSTPAVSTLCDRFISYIGIISDATMREALKEQNISFAGFMKGEVSYNAEASGSLAVIVIENAVFLGIFMLSMGYLVSGSYNPFLYFRF